MAIRLKILALLFLSICTSCGTFTIHKTSDFKTLNSHSRLNGVYYAEGQSSAKKNKNFDKRPISLLSLFNLPGDDADFISLHFEGNNKLLVDYKTVHKGTITGKHLEFSGKWKRNFFEIYLSKKQFFIPLIYGIFNIDRLRLGVDSNGNLFIRNFYDRSGYMIFFAGGSSGEYPYNFIREEQYKGLIPFEKDSLWGFKDNDDNIIIKPQYGFARTFKYNAARILINGKWELADTSGKPLTESGYDSISKPDIYDFPPVYTVLKSGKFGLADTLGRVICAAKYDAIDSGYGQYFRTKLGTKYGIASRQKTIVPAVYDRVQVYENNGYFTVYRNGVEYLADTQGYEYDIMPPPCGGVNDFLFPAYFRKMPDISTRRVAN